MALDCPNNFIKSNDPEGLSNETLCAPLHRYTGPCELPLTIPDTISERYKLEGDCEVNQISTLK